VSRFLLVELEVDLDHHARQAAWDWILLAPAVQRLTDMEVLSPQTYEQWMLPRQMSLVSAAKKARPRR